VIPTGAPLTVNGWHLYAHPAFLRQLNLLMEQVERAREKDPVGYRRKNAAKRLAAIRQLILERIPSDPTAPEYR
jgi:toxin YhaV